MKDEPKYRDQRAENARRSRAGAAAALAAQERASERFDWDRAIELFRQKRRRK